jgi:Skp family chaperone for outer membrane proteins
MDTFRRIAAIVVIIVSVVMLLLSLSGIAEAWILRGQLSSSLQGILTAAESRAAMMQKGLDRLDTVFAQVSEQISAVEHEVQTFGTDLERNKPLLTAISDRLGLDFAPLVDSARELMTTVRETVAAVNSTVEAINAIPFVSVSVPEVDTLRQLSQGVEDFRTEVQDLRTAIEERRSEIIQGTVSIVTTPTTQLGATVDEMQASVAGYSQELGAVREELSTLRSTITRGLTWAAVILTLALFWIALSQIVLIVLAWRAFSGQAPLLWQRQELATGQQAEPRRDEEEKT